MKTSFSQCHAAIGLAASFLFLSPMLHAQDKKKVDFAKDIQPILKESCLKCHGPEKHKGGLRLDSKEAAMKGGDDGPIIVPGNAAKSMLIERLTTDKEDDRMPQKADPLPPAKIKLFKDWLDQGAEWPNSAAGAATKHWAYQKAVRPELPKVRDKAWARNPIDPFILARLDKEKLRPSAEADRITLIRRLSFDLRGLPPTTEEVDAFLADKSKDAYEKLVERMLASPAYGERMAVFWLDLVRYADSVGYHSDNPMNVSPYRDYVIAAFNDNKPFDQFTTEQLAGDLIPNATTSQKVASAFNRLLQTTEEGGAQPKEYEYKYLCDRVRNTGTAWMGATIGCSQCHNHKYDPFTTRDFYSFGAFFADVKEDSVGRRELGMPVLDEKQTAELKQFEAAVVEAKKKFDAPSPELAASQAEWEKQMSAPVEWTPLDPTELTAANGTVLTKQADNSVLASGQIPPKEKYTVSAKTNLKGVTAFRLEALPDPAFAGQGPGASPNGNFVMTEFKVKVTVGEETSTVKLAAASADFSQDTFPIANAIDGKNDTGWAVLPQVGKAHTAIFEAKAPIADDSEKTFSFTLDFQSIYPQHQIGKFRIAVTTSANPSGGLTLPENIRKILAVASAQLTDAQKNELTAYYRSIAPLLEPLRKELAAAEKRKTDFLDKAPKVLVSSAGPMREVRIKSRGNWLDESGEVMQPNTPAFLPLLGVEGRRATRLDLAKWMVARDNPLTARVFVNRLWKLYFGIGISKSLDDFGKQGEPPVHPELLDWLAAEFMESGWDVKHVVKLIVTSAAYRQTSNAPKQLRERDPYNRLYARQSPFRLDAEFVRDNALAVSGLLVDKVGGPSVFPYQPAGYWAALNFPTREWQNSKGEGLYRRGLYTHWQRTFLHPSLYAFDACTREEATAERQRSNTPLQAFVLLNDPTYVEAARVFAQRILKEGGATPDQRLDYAYRRAVARHITPKEAKVLTELEQKHLAEFSKDKDAARKFISIGETPAPSDVDAAELAAWTSVARTILNLHETITRE